MDLNFERFVSTSIIKLLWSVSIGLALLGLLGSIFLVATGGEDPITIIAWAAGSLVGLLLIRLVCEGAIVVFRIAEDLAQIRRSTRDTAALMESLRPTAGEESHGIQGYHFSKPAPPDPESGSAP